MSFRPLARALGLVGIVFGCSTPAPKTPEQAKPEPAEPSPPPPTRENLQALVSREIEPLPLLNASDPKGAWTLQVEGVRVEHKPRAGSTEVVVHLGTTQPMTCFVYDHGIDVGGTLAKLIASTGREVEYQVVAPVAAVPVADTPAFMVDAVYLAQTEAGHALGELKIGIYGSLVAPVLCLHDEPGYRASFSRIFTGLLRSLRRKAAPVEPQFVELHLARIEDVPLGYYRRAVYQKDGSRELRQWGVMLYAPSPNQLRFEDSETVLQLDKAGRVQRGMWVKALNGALSTRIDVQREAANRYKFEGSHEGRKVSGRFQVKDKKGLSSEVSVAQALLGLKPGHPTPLGIEEYHPGLDPEKTVTVNYMRDAAEPTRFQMSLGDGSMTGIVDEQGMFKRIEAGGGQALMISERVMSAGKL